MTAILFTPTAIEAGAFWSGRQGFVRDISRRKQEW